MTWDAWRPALAPAMVWRVKYVSRGPRPPLDGLLNDLCHLEGAPPYPWLTLPPMPSAVVILNLGAVTGLNGCAVRETCGGRRPAGPVFKGTHVEPVWHESESRYGKPRASLAG